MSSLPVSTPEPRTRRRAPLRAAVPEPELEIAITAAPKPARARRHEPLRAADPVPERPALSLVGPPDEASGPVGAPDEAPHTGPSFLEGLAPGRVHVLHHRRIAGPDAALNHLVVTQNGVCVVALVEVAGVVELAAKRNTVAGDELLIKGVSGAPLVKALDLQVARVMDALDHIGVDEVPVRGAICLVDTQLAQGQRPVRVSGHEVSWPAALTPLLVAPGPFDDDDREAMRQFLDRTFPSAG